MVNTTWSYGVTTVPERRHTYLPGTLNSLRNGGFGEPILFVDGDLNPGPWIEQFGLEVRCRPRRLGVVGAWISAAMEIYLANPRAHRYAIFQDDLLCYRNLREYLDRCTLPPKGYYNLYTFTSLNEQIIKGKPIGWYEAGLVNPPDKNPRLYQTGRGAVALVFDNQGLRNLLSNPGLIHKPSVPGIQGRTKIDGAIVTCMNNDGYREYIHNPTLVGHQGINSSRPEAKDPSSAAYRYARMKATTWKGEQFDALELLQQE